MVTVLTIYKIVDDDDLPSNGSDDGDYVYFKSIKDAIDHAEDGVAIMIPPGVYHGIDNVGLNINKNIFLMSEPNKTGDVVIDGEGKSWIWNISATNITILGFTFINGYTDGDGAALNFNKPLDNSTIIANFINNKAANGGAIYFASTGANINASLFTHNVAEYDGGTIYFSNGCVIGNDTFSYNKADRGGAIFQVGDLSKKDIAFESNDAKEGSNIFVVGTADPNLGFSINDVNEGESVFMEITTDSSYSGLVFVEVNDFCYHVNVVDGYGNASINLNPGIYIATAIFRGSEKYKISTITTEFEVHAKELIDPDLRISVANVTSTQPVLIEIHATPNYSGNVSVMLNYDSSKLFTVNVVNGYGNAIIGKLNPGCYTAMAYCDAIDDFDASSDSTDFEVYEDDSLIDPMLAINVTAQGIDKPIIIEFFANRSYSGDFRIQIDPFIDYMTNIDDGYKKITLNGLFGGIYTIIATAYSTDVFKESTVSMEFKVDGQDLSDFNPYGNASSQLTNVSKPAGSTVSAKVKSLIAAKSKAYVINYGGKYSVTLKDAQGKAISNRKITFVLAGKSIGFAKTNSKGVATIKLSPNILKKIKAGEKRIVIKFAGDNKYKLASKTAIVTIKKEKVRLIAKKKSFKKSLKTKKYSVFLKNSKGKAIRNARISLRINGKTYYGKTNKKGKIIFNIKKLNKKGKYQAIIRFKGNRYFNAISKKATISVK
ncbi:hypothetical protein [uncultured Methanobrevibacter sp.]|uniref:hypothetical protein n=1 Tax=uncultured Methanobrevibacter sp. TaxID=253161 RepID=UPI0025F90ED3|nr:hypothetical protein [uncultured Methanobrevibacter sp.]